MTGSREEKRRATPEERAIPEERVLRHEISSGPSRWWFSEPTVTEIVLEPEGGGWPYHLALLKWAVKEGFDRRRAAWR